MCNIYYLHGRNSNPLPRLVAEVVGPIIAGWPSSQKKRAELARRIMRDYPKEFEYLVREMDDINLRQSA